MRRMTALGVGAVAGLTARALTKGLTGPTWVRTNYAGRNVNLRGGVAAALSASVAQAVVSPAGAIASFAGGAAGLLDDVAGDSRSRGLKGHLSALARGQITTGSLKIAGIGVGAMCAAALVVPRPRTAFDILTGTALIAGGANLVNLLDLRPGRALKVVIAGAGAAALAGSTAAAATVGAAAVALPDDLNEVTMLGDTGANAFGGTLGAALAAHPSRSLRVAATAGVVMLTLASEKVSFTKVIEATPVLNAIDMWGRRA